MMELAGKTAIVTGAAQGLGATFAQALGQAGANVVVGDIADTTETCGAITKAGGSALGVHLDVAESPSVEAAVQAAQSAFGGVDILVNNAAISGSLRGCLLTEIDDETWDRVLAVNLRGTFACIRSVVPIMRARGGGAIINLASGTALKGAPGILHYVASKGAIIAMTRASARELGDFGIRVNALAPGLIMSESVRRHPHYRGDALAANIASRALKREGDPVDLVGALLFLASPASAFVTGQTLVVDGGSVMT